MAAAGEEGGTGEESGVEAGEGEHVGTGVKRKGRSSSRSVIGSMENRIGMTNES